MDKITSQSFFQAWHEIVNSRKDDLLKIWRSPAKVTSYIKGDDKCVMDAVADKLKLHCYPNDYYSIDTILYKKEDLVPGLNEGQYCLRDIRVAFEHENLFNVKLREEVSHLLITNCDLRVLVTYPPNDEKEQSILDYLGNIIEGNRQSKVISDEESFLIIFGYEDGFCWDGYVFKKDKWKKIKEA